MTPIRFDLEDVMTLVRRCEEADDPDTRPSFYQKTQGNEDPDPALHFVHDQGVYLMNNLSDQPEELEDRVVYAKGLSPDDSDWHRKCRRAVGGDDFVETLPLAWARKADEAGMDEFVIMVGDDSIELRVDA